MTASAPHGHARAVRTTRARALADAVAEGLFPGPRDPLEAARQALTRALQRGAPPMDEVRFGARCPACGQDCEWRETRVETRLRVEVGCRCQTGETLEADGPGSALEQAVPPVLGPVPVQPRGRG